MVILFCTWKWNCNKCYDVCMSIITLDYIILSLILESDRNSFFAPKLINPSDFQFRKQPNWKYEIRPSFGFGRSYNADSTMPESTKMDSNIIHLTNRLWWILYILCTGRKLITCSWFGSVAAITWNSLSFHFRFRPKLLKSVSVGLYFNKLY